MRTLESSEALCGLPSSSPGSSLCIYAFYYIGFLSFEGKVEGSHFTGDQFGLKEARISLRPFPSYPPPSRL